MHIMQETNWYSEEYTGAYYLESDVHVRNGATLSIDGAETDAFECETLLLVSVAPPSAWYVNYSIICNNVKITVLGFSLFWEALTIVNPWRA